MEYAKLTLCDFYSFESNKINDSYVVYNYYTDPV